MQTNRQKDSWSEYNFLPSNEKCFKEGSTFVVFGLFRDKTLLFLHNFEDLLEVDMLG